MGFGGQLDYQQILGVYLILPGITGCALTEFRTLKEL